MEKAIKALIVDDDESARNILQKFLELDDKVKVLKSVNSAAKASKVLNVIQPEVIFLDINMPNEDGVHFAYKIKEQGYEIPIVFTTAYGKYAASAFNLKPIDFLIKPFGVSEVFDVLTKLDKYFEEKRLLKIKRSKLVIPKKLKLKTRRGLIFLSPEEILFATVDKDRADVYTVKGEHFRVATLLSDIYGELKKFNFFKVNRSSVVNMKYVESVDKATRKCVIKCDKNNYEFVMSLSIFRNFENVRSLNLG